MMHGLLHVRVLCLSHNDGTMRVDVHSHGDWVVVVVVVVVLVVVVGVVVRSQVSDRGMAARPSRR